MQNPNHTLLLYILICIGLRVACGWVGDVTWTRQVLCVAGRASGEQGKLKSKEAAPRCRESDASIARIIWYRGSENSERRWTAVNPKN